VCVISRCSARLIISIINCQREAKEQTSRSQCRLRYGTRRIRNQYYVGRFLCNTPTILQPAEVETEPYCTFRPSRTATVAWPDSYSMHATAGVEIVIISTRLFLIVEEDIFAFGHPDPGTWGAPVALQQLP